MADHDFYGAERSSGLGDALRGFGWANWAGAATSLGLTAIIAVWAVDLTFRDVSDVPVIRAMEGPMRVAPADPGGSQAPYQGMALSDITSGGAASPAPDEIVLAPPASALDAPSQADRHQAAKERLFADTPDEPAPPASGTVAAASDTAPTEGETPPAADIATTDPAPVVETPAEDVSDGTRDAIAAALSEAIGTPGPGINRSTRPARRPARTGYVTPAPLSATPAVATGADAELQPIALYGGAAKSTRDADPAAILPGTRIVQLGAYNSESSALEAWDRLDGDLHDYMDGKQRLVEKAHAGGREFWRLRAVGFEDGSEARRFCSALIANDAPCIPVTVY
ncbi:MAG: SPOR domain-containing protein [Jannaschia sp.]